MSHLYDPAYAVANLVTGQRLLVVCCLFYLAWWAVAFRPGRRHGQSLPAIVILLAGAIVTGATGLCMSFVSVLDAPGERIVPGCTILALGIGLFLVLLAVTVLALGRRFTCELFLIVGWTALEYAAVDVLRSAGRMTHAGAVAMDVALALAFVVSVVMYALYYRLRGRHGYVAGMVPLVSEGVSMLLLLAVTA